MVGERDYNGLSGTSYIMAQREVQLTGKVPKRRNQNTLQVPFKSKSEPKIRFTAASILKLQCNHVRLHLPPHPPTGSDSLSVW